MRPPRRLVAGGEDTEVGTTRVRHGDGVVRVAAVRSARACGACTAARGRPTVVPAPAAILQRLRERELGAVWGPGGREPREAGAYNAAVSRVEECDLVAQVARGRERQRRAVWLPGRAVVTRRVSREPREFGAVGVYRAEIVVARVHPAVEGNFRPVWRPSRTSHEPHVLGQPHGAGAARPHYIDTATT